MNDPQKEIPFLCRKRSFTIDRPGTVMFDDAICVTQDLNGGYTVWVSIVNISNKISEGSFCTSRLCDLLCKGIQEQESDSYLFWPLEEREMKKSLSLTQEKKRDVLCYEVGLSECFEVISLEAHQSEIEVRGNLTFSQFEERSRDPRTDDDYILQLFSHVAWGIRSWRLGWVTLSHSLLPSGRDTIFEYMNLVNNLMTIYAEEKKIPIIYLAETFRSRRRCSSFSQRYSRWTSPLRRWSDCINLLNLSAYLEKEEYPLSAEDLKRERKTRFVSEKSNIHSRQSSSGAVVKMKHCKKKEYPRLRKKASKKTLRGKRRFRIPCLHQNYLD